MGFRTTDLETTWRRLATSCAGVLALVCVSGCEVAQLVIAPQNEYNAYRKVRTARSIEERLRASEEYLRQHPEGRWRSEVRPWYQRAEAKYYAHREENAQGLEEYLALLPEGPHAYIARLELARHRARTAEGAQAQLQRDARLTEQRLAGLAKQREVAREAFGLWIGHLLSIRSWGQRTSELDHEFLWAWRIDKPKGRCVDDRCSKLLELPFQLPGGGDLAEREMTLEVVLTLEQGALKQASVQGPSLFSRLYEAARSTPVVADDTEARKQAIAFAVEFVGGAAEARLPASRCKAQTEGTIVLKRACDGLTMEVEAASDPAADDKVVVQGEVR